MGNCSGKCILDEDEIKKELFHKKPISHNTNEEKIYDENDNPVIADIVKHIQDFCIFLNSYLIIIKETLAATDREVATTFLSLAYKNKKSSDLLSDLINFLEPYKKSIADNSLKQFFSIIASIDIKTILISDDCTHANKLEKKLHSLKFIITSRKGAVFISSSDKKIKPLPDISKPFPIPKRSSNATQNKEDKKNPVEDTIQKNSLRKTHLTPPSSPPKRLNSPMPQYRHLLSPPISNTFKTEYVDSEINFISQQNSTPKSPTREIDLITLPDSPMPSLLQRQYRRLPRPQIEEKEKTPSPTLSTSSLIERINLPRDCLNTASTSSGTDSQGESPTSTNTYNSESDNFSPRMDHSLTRLDPPDIAKITQPSVSQEDDIIIVSPKIAWVK